MRKWLALIGLFLMLGSESGKAQDGIIDSLKVVIITGEDDTIKVQNLILLSQNFAGTDNPNAIYYASKARDLAITLNYQPGRAKALKYIGLGYYYQAEFVQTIDYWEQSLAVYEDIGDKLGIANILSNLGAVNTAEGDETRGIEYLLRSRTIAEEVQDTFRLSTVLLNIGFVYSKKEETYDKALEYYNQALPLFEYQNYADGIGTVTLNIGVIFLDKGEYDSAEVYVERSLKAVKGTEIEPSSLYYLGRVYAGRGEYERALLVQQQAMALAKSYGSKLDEAKAIMGMGETYQLQGQHRRALDLYLQAMPLLQGTADFKNELQEVYEGLSLSFAEVNDFQNAYKYQELLTAIKDTLFYAANQKKLDLLVSIFDNEKKQGEIELLTKDKALQEANLQKEKIVKNAFLGGFVVIFVIAFIIFRNYRNKVKTNKLLDKQNEEIEGLLLNILPAEVAKELQHEGYATPQNYESATVLFTDFKGFTQISSGLLPHELIAELNSYFNEFDDIIGKHNLEKIKTIGDAYMCAGGIPSANTTHAVDAVEAGLAIQKYIARKNEKRNADGLVPWELRVGIHTGPIVAGVVGRKKYAYDIWGDAVNIASRMESNGEAYKVNISEATYHLVKDKFKCVARGKISVKGAGEKDMYFVEGPIAATHESSETEKVVSDDVPAS
jgi:class 3 adenylate cyclase/Tfp pilus assembly protein PilF